MKILEKCKKCVDKGKVLSVLSIDVSKELNVSTTNYSQPNCMFADLSLIHDYLSNRKQRIKIENIYST